MSPLTVPRARFHAAALGCLVVALCVDPWVAPAWAADAAAGKARAQVACGVCHGPTGLSVAPDAPNLAGQPAIYLSAQLRAFRSGARRHEVMNVIAKPLTDDDIDNLATWFSSIRIEARPPS